MDFFEQLSKLEFSPRRRKFAFRNAVSFFPRFAGLKNLLIPLSMLMISLSAFGQNSAQNSDVIKIETDLVPFEVTVTDRQGNPVRNLKAEDFRVYEDGVERKIDFFEPLKREDGSRPLSVVFALDISGSMTAEELEKLRGAMQIFLGNLVDYNSYFAVMTFGMEVKTLQSFTNRPEKLEKVFDKLAKDQSGLSTHAYDAVDDAVRLLQKKSPSAVKNGLPKRVVVVITDGFPVGDTVKPQTVIERANLADISVYSIILPSFSRLQMGKKPLPTPLEVSGLIDKTGGKSFYAGQKNYDPLFKSLAEELTASYLLAFYPSREEPSGDKPRRIRVVTKENYLIKQNRTDYKPPN